MVIVEIIVLVGKDMSSTILYFVDRASHYNCLLMANLTKFFVSLFIIPFYVFRASQRSSSGDRIVLINHLVWLVRVSDCLVCRSGGNCISFLTCIPSGHRGLINEDIKSASSWSLANNTSSTPHIILTLNLLTTTIVAPPRNARKWQMGFNSAFKGLNVDVSTKSLIIRKCFQLINLCDAEPFRITGLLADKSQ